MPTEGMQKKFMDKSAARGGWPGQLACSSLTVSYLVIHKESHARRGHAEKFMDKSAARGGWLRRPAADRLAEPLRSHELSLLNQLEPLLMHKETYAIKNPQDLLNFFMRADALGQQKYLSRINLL